MVCYGLVTVIAGLLHISQLATSRVDNVEDVVSVGDRLFVKVIEIVRGRLEPLGKWDNGRDRRLAVEDVARVYEVYDVRVFIK